MATYVALLRAVNVGGTGNLPMSALRSLCEDCGFSRVRTYIASGNVLFDTESEPAKLQADLEDALLRHVGKPVGVVLRSAAELIEVLDANPYATRAPNLVHVVFLDASPPNDTLANISGRAAEEIALGSREIYVYYPQGQGASKLKLPAGKAGTARNINTVAKLAELAGA